MQHEFAFSHLEQADVCIIGMGYVGLTLAAALADHDLRVLGIEVNPRTYQSLLAHQSPFFEPGLDQALARHLGKQLMIAPQMPDRLPPVVIICVGSPFDTEAKQPDLRQLHGAVNSIAGRISADTLVIVRSTLPVGTTRSVVLPALQATVENPLVAFCPERIIQGKALEELATLPQIVGGVNQEATQRAAAFFQRLTPKVISVSSLEAAEMIKLICNAHTDLIYGFGNEVALMANALGLDARELISAANLDYPRPDLSKPGFVGGSCLIKDPYLLMYSVQNRGYTPGMVAAARTLNESIPAWIANRVLAQLESLERPLANCKIFITGFAYKGQPETDDLRGSAIFGVLETLRKHQPQLFGHDFVVPVEHIAALEVEPVDLAAGFEGADAVIILNNHRQYFSQDIQALAMRMRRPAVIFDAWGVFQKQLQELSDIHYARLSWSNMS